MERTTDMARNTWTKQGRFTDESGTPWDQFVSANGVFLKRESRDCFDSKGRCVGHSMRQYALAAEPKAWYDFMRDVLAIVRLRAEAKFLDGLSDGERRKALELLRAGK